MLRYLTDIDHRDHEAMTALDEKTGEGVGVARYVRDRERHHMAEVAVIDDWQARGVGTLLLEMPSGRARAKGITTFTALMLATNREMMELFEQLDPMRIVDQAIGTVEIDVSIAPIGVAPRLRKLLAIAAQHDVAVPLSHRNPLPALGTPRPQERA